MFIQIFFFSRTHGLEPYPLTFLKIASCRSFSLLELTSRLVLREGTHLWTLCPGVFPRNSLQKYQIIVIWMWKQISVSSVCLHVLEQTVGLLKVNNHELSRKLTHWPSKWCYKSLKNCFFFSGSHPLKINVYHHHFCCIIISVHVHVWKHVPYK